MTTPSIRDKSLDEWLAVVQGLATVGDAGQVRSIMTVVAKCTQELTDGLATAAAEAKRLTDTTAEFNTQAGHLNEQLVRLNRSLTWATWVIAVGTVLVAGAAIVTIWHTAR
jgi:hypothetical protein